MRVKSLLPAWVVLATATATTASVAHNNNHQLLYKRDGLQTCTDLTVSSNNGDRNVAIVIDSSSSMYGSDPYDLRLAAGRALNNFLVSDAEASGGGKADKVTVVGFDSYPYTLFPPGNPGDPKADEAISSIVASGGTYIAGGVETATQWFQNSTLGVIKDRSAIVVFTDGEDSNTAKLVSAINNATALGIRVSFGFLDSTLSAQPVTVLRAIRQSKGVYATIAVAAGSQNFINYVLLNGLTYQDNAQGAGNRLLAGLATTYDINGADTVSMQYVVEAGERVNFTIYTFTGDNLTAEARMGGQQVATLLPTYRSLRTEKFLNFTAPFSGTVDLLVSARNSPKDGLFSVLPGSSSPIKNCTVGIAGQVAPSAGLSGGAKAGIGIGVIAAVGALAAGGFYAWKYFGATGGEGTTAAAGGMNTTAAANGMGPNTTGFNPTGAEKFGPSVDISSMPPTPGQGFGGPMYSIPPNGFEGNMAQQGLQNLSAPGSMPAAGGMPAATGGPLAATGGAVGAGGVYGPPSVFVPPMVPPQKFGNNSSDPDKKEENGSTLQNVSPYASPPIGSPDSGNQFQPPYSSGNQFQNPMSYSGNQYQNPMSYSGNQFQQPMVGNDPGFQQNMGGYNDYQNMSSGGGGNSSAPLSSYNSPPSSNTPLSGFDGNMSNHPNGFDGNMSNNQNHTSFNNGGNTAGYDTNVNTNTTGYDSGNHTAYNHNPSAVGQTGGGGEYHNPPGGGGGAPHPPPPNQNPQPGFNVPNPPSWSQNRGGQDKHHHHAWLSPDTACEHSDCPLHGAGHQCSPSAEACPCTCRDPECPVTKRLT
ncbi:hypothetical protein B0H63DRAFT_458816 [Podospora didyma]|uniref:VWFA domain-containing protein n=1 Tax=Podospora didyma TaxID=330526 RepID=A0AAE0U7D0_9PEZI|nr:hypothetical protein B0H63DRAFT_458816 [Podospora didyma]